MKKLLYITTIILLFASCRTVKITTYSGQKPVEFVGDTIFHTEFENLDSFETWDGFYNDADVWFSEEAIELTSEGLLLKSYKDTAYHESWDDKRVTSWTSGAIRSHKLFQHSMGTWIFVAKTDNSKPAIWLLKDEYFVDGFEIHKIIPEIDIMEIIHNSFRQTIHWGYVDGGYRKYDHGSYIKEWDNKWHEYAVVMLPDGYDFYFDRILVSSLRSKNWQFVSNEDNYIILNNSCDHEMKEDNYNFYVKSITVLK